MRCTRVFQLFHDPSIYPSIYSTIHPTLRLTFSPSINQNYYKVLYHLSINFEFTFQGVSPSLQNMVCPTKQCPFPLACGNPVKTYTPETFFVCPECPMCPGDILKGVSARLGKVVRIAQPKTKPGVKKAISSNR